jgi:hypothetical protein
VDDQRSPSRSTGIPSAILGDVLQNLRSALDQAVWKLVEANGAQPDRHNGFPFLLTARTEVLENQLRGCSGAARDAIAEFQPYHTGVGEVFGPLLYLVGELSRIDRHQHLHLVTAD